MSSIRLHVDELDFYVIFNCMRLYFTNRVDIEKYGNLGLNLPKIKSQYNQDAAYKIYYQSLNIRDKETAILKALNFHAKAQTHHIASFNIDEHSLFQVYHANKVKLINDFKGELKNDLVKDLLSGNLYNRLTIKNYKIELYSYINLYYPILKLAKSFSKNNALSRILNNIQSNTEKQSNIEKCSYILKTFIEPKDEALKQTIATLIETEITDYRNRNLQPKQTENTEYDYFYC